MSRVSSSGRTWWWCWRHSFWWYWWRPSGYSDPDSGSHSCSWPWRYALAILQHPMARAHPDVAVSGLGGSPRPQPQPAAMFIGAPPLFAPFWTPPAQPSQQPTCLGGGTRPHWRSPSAPWGGRRRSAPSGSPTRVPPYTPPDMLVSSPLSDPHTPLVLLPSWLMTGLAFLSPPWVLLLALSVFLMFLLLLRCCLLYTSPSPRDGLLSRMPSSA